MLAKKIGNGIAAAFRAVPDLTRDAAAIGGAGLIAYGAWQIYAPAGMIVAGVLILSGVLLSARG